MSNPDPTVETESAFARSNVAGLNGWLAQLSEAFVAALRRASAHQEGRLRAGDRVELTIARKDDHLTAGTVLRVCLMGVDGTADVGHPHLWERDIVYTAEIEPLRLLQDHDLG